MPTPIPPDRLPRMREALERYGPDQKESQQHLAQIYGVALSRFVTLIKSRFKDFPPHERHGDKTHWYPARAAIEAMIAYTMRQGANRRDAATRASAALQGKPVPSGDGQTESGGNPAWPEGLLTPTELDRLASAETRLWRLRQAQQLYVLKSEADDLARRVYSLVSSRIMNIPNVIDASGKMPAAERAALGKECRAILLALVKEVGEAIANVDDGDDEGPGGAGGSVDHPRLRRRRHSADGMAGSA